MNEYKTQKQKCKFYDSGMNSQSYYDKYIRNNEARSFYKSTAWKKCRQLALDRDNHLCQDCLKLRKISAADMVHHIEELADKPGKALDLDNLISLCHPCHNKRHPEKGKREEKPVRKKIKVIKVKSNPETI